MSRRRAGGPPNGACEVCGDPTPSLEADCCSKACRDELDRREQKAEYYQQLAEQQQDEPESDLEKVDRVARHLDDVWDLLEDDSEYDGLSEVAREHLDEAVDALDEAFHQERLSRELNVDSDGDDRV